MYKPLFLGINDATMGDWRLGLCILIILVVIAGIIVYYTAIKSIIPPGNHPIKGIMKPLKLQPENPVSQAKT